MEATQGAASIQAHETGCGGDAGCGTVRAAAASVPTDPISVTCGAVGVDQDAGEEGGATSAYGGSHTAAGSSKRHGIQVAIQGGFRMHCAVAISMEAAC